MYYCKLLSFFIISVSTLVAASPVVRKTLNPRRLKIRSPLSDAVFDATSDWPTNVVMTGGSQTYGMWVPIDGTWYDLGSITCLGLPAYAEGPCDGMTIDQIGVVSGDGPCDFIGDDGYSVSIPGVAGGGYYTVGPPQNIMSAKCG
ncbi:hypothetical protein LTR10_021321 [Elasticomyces elasticus]|uniref:Uncharacterized protein n=1 Tax=Exophiala sideris TaxID=1016849 RepID=A0ABR0JEX1_9EURO|nr:hypothetical protein LTR10_021321 [Elasticomyces elasticus]KAK5027553.1 hypothetical protein LTR13_009485 [Exophiala sideris]KAK5032884.1 hypothetical protein LTS07_004295 [Exophiala sideris]KAK5062408.1 hypothetical protein LTR69_004767 [Exophiala sideris]KAK5177566.1 hypothetical protein LTR44_009977 [Eurotiomycetes sp. CCFEE 6388]